MEIDKMVAQIEKYITYCGFVPKDKGDIVIPRKEWNAIKLEWLNGERE